MSVWTPKSQSAKSLQVNSSILPSYLPFTKFYIISGSEFVGITLQGQKEQNGEQWIVLRSRLIEHDLGHRCSLAMTDGLGTRIVTECRRGASSGRRNSVAKVGRRKRACNGLDFRILGRSSDTSSKNVI